MKTSNEEFLTALFGVDAPWCHVTSFTYDPGNIPKDRHLAAWKGDYHSRHYYKPNSNQYFTISCFYADEQGQARRRKALYRHTPVIVLDDVKEKLSLVEVQKLPRPTWILETSTGSEQWGYLLDTPCTERHVVENLLDGLVANGLAPDGRDPGMKGVTRYVRLPEGVNTKTSKSINGEPFKCRMLVWEPFNRVSMEQLAAPFAVDLNAERREQRIDGAASVDDHPILNAGLTIKEVRSDGRFDIICPWVDEHTGADDSGAAIFTNDDGSIGFKCHHGACQERTGHNLLQHIEGQTPGFMSTFKNWQVMREFSQLETTPTFITQTPLDQPVIPAAQTPLDQPDPIQQLVDSLRRERPSTKQARDITTMILKHVDSLPKMDQKRWHDEVIILMGWTKPDFKEILKDLRSQWYEKKSQLDDFYNDVIFVKELNQFYDFKSRIFYSAEAFQNSFSHEDAEARKIALQDGRVRKVDRLDYAPKNPVIFTDGGRKVGNTWSDASQQHGVEGDISMWKYHFDALGWGEHRTHIEKWMAFTLRHPDQKINHMLLLGSGEGCGKDYLLYPLSKAMGDNYTVISGEELIRDFDDHLLSTKYLHINETELGDRREAMIVSNKLKPLAAAPPDTLRVNQKGIKPIKIRNIINATMTTNSQMPMKLNGTSRRFYAVWSDLNTRDQHDNMTRAWLQYWDEHWEWMKRGGGWQAVTHYLMTQVDLTGFNPAAAPPMTEFLRDIKEASKTPMQQTMEAFINKRHGAFRCDLLTASDMSDTLKAGAIFATNNMHCDGRFFTPVKVGMVLKELGNFTKITSYKLGTPIRLWVLRDREKYEKMNSSDLYTEYERQINGAQAELKKNAVLKAVK